MKYGQHETFHLRLNWLRKGIKMLKANPRFFFEKNAAETIGLGKNMVQSLRFWITATGIAKEVKGEDNKSIHKLSNIGEIIDDYDPYLDLADSLAILHYCLVVKENFEDRLYIWHGFFNETSRSSITKDEIITEVANWSAREGEHTSENSLKRDVDCLVRLYCKESNPKDPEDVTHSPFGRLGLISISEEDRDIIIKNQLNYKNIGLTALMYILLKYGEKNETDNVSIEEIENKPDLWGKLFNLQRSEIINALEDLSEHLYYPIQFQRTNRLNTVSLPKITPFNFLQEDYARKVGNN
jgi:hypothetical protein